MVEHATPDDAFEWVASADPAVLFECEGNPFQMNDGLLVRPRRVQLRPGYILEDVVGDPSPSGPLACDPHHYRRSMEVAQLLAHRESNARLQHLTSRLECSGGDHPRREVVAAPVGPGTPTGKSGPMTTWAAVARAVGVSVDTMGRRRKEWRDIRPHPYYIDAAAAQAWYRHGHAGGGPGVPHPASGRKARPSTATGKLGTTGTTLADLLAEKVAATAVRLDAKAAAVGTAR